MTKRMGALIAVAALAAYFLFLYRHTSFFAAGPDSSGYMNEAKLLSGGHLRVPLPQLALFGFGDDAIWLFTPLGFVPAKHATMVPTYPAGLPLHILVAARVGGWERAAFLVGPLTAIGCLLLCYAVGRELGLPSPWALIAPVMLAPFPIFIDRGVQTASDDLAMLWALAAIFCALRAQRQPLMATAAGAAFAIGVWVRPTNILLALPLAFAFRWRLPLLARSVVAAAPIGIALGWYNYELYGIPWKTGYGAFNDILIAEPICATFHLKALAKLLTPVVVPGGLLVVVDRRVDRWKRAMLATWFGVFYLFYAFYNYCPSAFATRLLLPAVPALLLGVALLLRDLASSWRVIGSIAAAVVVAAVVARGIYLLANKSEVLREHEVAFVYPETVRWTEQRLPSNAILYSALLTGAYYYYYPQRITVRYDQIFGDRLQRLQSSAAATLPWYALLSDVEFSGERLRQIIPGRWAVVGRNRDITLYRYERKGK